MTETRFQVEVFFFLVGGSDQSEYIPDASHVPYFSLKLTVMSQINRPNYRLQSLRWRPVLQTCPADLIKNNVSIPVNSDLKITLTINDGTDKISPTDHSIIFRVPIRPYPLLSDPWGIRCWDRVNPGDEFTSFFFTMHPLNYNPILGNSTNSYQQIDPNPRMNW